jgi:hypothetical protein
MKVFISYRRKDNMYLPASVRERFADRIGEDNVFFDVDSIPIASDFMTTISDWVAQTDVMIALIGPNWHPESLAHERDFVRQELLCAVRFNKTILPVLHSGQPMLTRGDVPAEFTWILDRNAFVIGTPPRHEQDISQLVERVLALDRSDKRSSGTSREGARREREPSLDFISESSVGSALRARLRRRAKKGEQ